MLALEVEAIKTITRRAYNFLRLKKLAARPVFSFASEIINYRHLICSIEILESGDWMSFDVTV
jgi:hypothetical protein